MSTLYEAWADLVEAFRDLLSYFNPEMLVFLGVLAGVIVGLLLALIAHGVHG